MIFGSVCSGIEAASEAWDPLGWRAAFVSEIEKFPRAVLEHRLGAREPAEGERWSPSWNGPALLGDFTAIRAADWPMVELLVGGTPCQAFSIAGKKGSLDDPRGRLSLAYVELVHDLSDTGSLRWAVWENVPDVLKTDDNAFGCFLAGLVGADTALRCPRKSGRWPGVGLVCGPRGVAAWRILDAQYFGLAQRRERVFLVFSPAAAGGDPAAVLFEPQGSGGNSPPRRETGQDAAAGPGRGPEGGGGRSGGRSGCGAGGDRLQGLPDAGDHAGGSVPVVRGDAVAPTLSARTKGGGGLGLGTDTELDGALVPEVCAPLRASAGERAGMPGDTDFENYVPTVAKCLTRTSAGGTSVDLETSDFIPEPIAFSCKDYGADAVEGLAPTMRAMGHAESHANAGGQLAVSIAIRGRGDDGAQMEVDESGVSHTLRGGDGGGSRAMVADPAIGWRVRRFTTTECARLQGFPDDHTLIPWRGRDATDCPDGPQYKAYGNSMAVAVMRWLGERIAAADAGLPRRRASV